MDRIEQLAIFVRVAETGNFTLSAQQLGLPRANVSLAVQQLEARLGVRLLHRTTRRVSLTPDGEALLERARGLVSDLEELEQQYHPVRATVAGRLRVDVPSRVARCLIAPALPTFFAQYPAIALELGASDRSVDLVQENLDCALRVGPLHSSSLVARPLGALAMVNCASPAYLARHGTPTRPADLASHQAVNYAAPTTGRVAPWEWMEGGTLRQLDLHSQVTVNNAETYIACALAGLGLVQVPAYDVRQHLHSGELLQVLPQACAPAMPVHLLYPHRRHLSPRMQVFAHWLQALLAPHCAAGP
nr:LysR family transcriptional regulator [uncultured Albidiferax sp.]